MENIYEIGLERGPGNCVPLTPVDFVKRSAEVYPMRTAVIHGDLNWNYATFYGRCCRLASALTKRGIGVGDTVSVIAPNIPAHLEAHYGVPMCGAVLNSINTRLDAAAIGFILDHGECSVLLVDAELAPVAKQALALSVRTPLVVDLQDPLGPSTDPIGSLTYEELLAEGDSEFHVGAIDNEWQAISLNYTSGTTGNPKGVVYHHRGAYLNALGNAHDWDMHYHPVYLWTLPMFHCNGWCFTWTVTALAGTHVCLRRVAAEPVIENLATHRVTHLCAAPIVLSAICNAPAELTSQIPAGIRIMTAGAAPPAAVIQATESLRMTVTHTYGLTETYGPCVVCAWHDEWDSAPLEERAHLKARQGVRVVALKGLEVMNPETLQPVPRDGETIGEIMFRGNVVMKGYLKNASATDEALAGGWFHSGDLAVRHPDGYIEIRDRSKDIIISGGENISSIEVEGVLYQHPAVLAAAVVAKPSEKWGETPCAFVELKPGARSTERELIDYCRRHLAHFKAPTSVVFGELPKTSTGKIQKFMLRDRVRQET